MKETVTEEENEKAEEKDNKNGLEVSSDEEDGNQGEDREDSGETQVLVCYITLKIFAD